jgi:hypothetical protein
MFHQTLTVDFHGLVLFDPDRLREFLGGHIEDGTNIYKMMTTSEAGDEVVQRGIVLPVLGINDSNYEIYARDQSEPSCVEDGIVFTHGIFPLHVTKRLVIADMAVLVEWEAEKAWRDLPFKTGNYAVTVRGFRYIKNARVARFGFEFCFEKQSTLPRCTADMTASMQVLELPTPV